MKPQDKSAARNISGSAEERKSDRAETYIQRDETVTIGVNDPRRITSNRERTTSGRLRPLRPPVA